MVFICSDKTANNDKKKSCPAGRKHSLGRMSLAHKIMKKLKKYQIQCPACGQIIESKHNFDFQVCKCGRNGIDGGKHPRILDFNPSEQESTYQPSISFTE